MNPHEKGVYAPNDEVDTPKKKWYHPRKCGQPTAAFLLLFCSCFAVDEGDLRMAIDLVGLVVEWVGFDHISD